MKKILLWVWQLPQHLLALVLIRILDIYDFSYESSAGINYRHFKPKNWFGRFLSGVSLGEYIIIKTHDIQTIKHEYGHYRQSVIFGWFYLLIIGIPSVCNNLWDRLFHKEWTRRERHKWYYSRYPEQWADRLGGVDREI